MSVRHTVIIISVIAGIIVAIYIFRKHRRMNMKHYGMGERRNLNYPMLDHRICIRGMTYKLNDQYLCLFGSKNKLPINNGGIEHSKYNIGSITLNNHPLILSDDSITIPGEWWSLRNTIDVISGYNDNTYFIMTSDGLYYYDSSLYKLTDKTFDQLFKYNGIPYVIDDGNIRKGISEIEYKRNNIIYRDNMYWNWEIVRSIAGTDIRDEYIEHVDVANHILKITTDDDIFYINSNGNDWIDDWNKVKLGNNDRHVLVFHDKDVSIMENNVIIYTVKNVLDAIIDPNNKYGMIVIDSDGDIWKYDYVDDNGARFDRVITHNRYKKRRTSMIGKGSRLIACDNRIIVISCKNHLLRL